MSARTLAIRPALTADAASLVTLINDAYGRTDEEPGWTSEAGLVEGPRVDEARVLELIGRSGSVVLAAERAGALVGCVHLERDQEEPGTCELGLLSVRVDVQAEGVGKALLSAAEAHARDQMQAERIEMHVVSERSQLLAWYERRGYERTGQTEPFEPPGEQRSLQGPLSFELLVKELA